MFGLYDVAIINDDGFFKIIQVLAISKIDAWHICEIKGYNVKDVAKSIE